MGNAARIMYIMYIVHILYVMFVLKAVDNMRVPYIIRNSYILCANDRTHMMLASPYGLGQKKRGTIDGFVVEILWFSL
jgi:hypothetical protein